MVNDLIKATGELTIVLLDKNQGIKQKIHVPNLVVSVGKEFIADRMIGTDSAVMSHMSVGTSNSNLATANTELVAELARVELDSAVRTTNTIRYTATFAPGTGSGALVEAGIFNAGTAGTMLCRTTYEVVNKDAADTLIINWDVTIN
jgi:hypothetical protein